MTKINEQKTTGEELHMGYKVEYLEYDIETERIIREEMLDDNFYRCDRFNFDDGNYKTEIESCEACGGEMIDGRCVYCGRENRY